ncbi:MAG: SirB2 family protein [Porticoccaceae bacterium]|nr:SirB2 family protein [Pseudomonadales bacterium]MCP5173138.1 SirB2 family protein [Pseudomonadales bacterium]
MYLTIKYAHIGFALISINLFVFRAALSIMGAPLLQNRWLKVLPHLNDTLLLSAAIYLMIAVGQYPFVNHWLTAKVVALLVYIGLGMVTLKYAKSTLSKLVFALLSISVFGFILWAAVTRLGSI